MLLGCGGGGGGGKGSSAGVSLNITTPTPTVLLSGTHQFVADVTGSSNASVTWEVTTADGGSISGSGLYTAPAVPKYATVKATSVADPTKSATTVVTVQSSTLSVTVLPSAPSVVSGGTQQFTATVAGTPNQNVAWSVVEANGGTISATGLYTAPMSTGSFTIKATAQADPAASGTTSITSQNVPMIAYATRLVSDLTWEIYTMDMDGGNKQRLTNNAFDDLQPAWSPDGSKIAFSSNRDGNYDIYTMNADGSEVTQITFTPDGYNYDPKWSPDGTKLLIQRSAGTSFDLFTINADGSNLINLAPYQFEDANGEWSPDGSKIVFYSLRPPSAGIFTMNADGSNVTKVPNTTSADTEAIWTPDGTQLLLCRFAAMNTRLVRINLDGSNPIVLTPGSGNRSYPSFSPDGSKVVYSNDLSSITSIYIMDANGGTETQLTFSDHWDAGAVIRPLN